MAAIFKMVNLDLVRFEGKKVFLRTALDLAVNEIGHSKYS